MNMSHGILLSHARTILVLGCLCSLMAMPLRAAGDFSTLLRAAEEASAGGRPTQALTRYLDAARQAPSEGQARVAWNRAQELAARHTELAPTLRAHQASFEQAYKRFQAPAPVPAPTAPHPGQVIRAKFTDLMRHAEDAASAGHGPQAITRYLEAARGAPSSGEVLTAWNRAQDLAKARPELAPVVRSFASDFRAAAGRFAAVTSVQSATSALRAAGPAASPGARAVPEITSIKKSGLFAGARRWVGSPVGRAGLIAAAAAGVVLMVGRSMANAPAPPPTGPVQKTPVTAPATPSAAGDPIQDLAEDLPRADRE